MAQAVRGIMDSNGHSNHKTRRLMIVAVFVVILGGVLGAWMVMNGKLPFASKSKQLPVASSHASMPMPAAGTNAASEEITITIPTETLDRIHLAFGKVTEGNLSVNVRVPGTVQPNGYREVRVTPLIGGVVTQVSGELGQTVHRGEPLAVVFSRELAEAQTSLISVNTELEREHKKLLRTQDLVKLGAVSRQELEEVEASHQVHLAHAEEARQRLLLLGLAETEIERVTSGRQASSNIAIPAPIDGIVTKRGVNLGQVVGMGQELFTVTDLSSVWVEGNLLENDFAFVRVGSRAEITTPAYAGRTYRGNVDYIEPQVDPQTRTAKVRVVVENSGLALRLGMYMDMSFSTSEGTKALVLPKQALQQIGSTRVVYVAGEEEGQFRERTVTVGEEMPSGIRVLAGVKGGERVVTEGSVLLRAESLRQHPR